MTASFRFVYSRSLSSLPLLRFIIRSFPFHALYRAIVSPPSPYVPYHTYGNEDHRSKSILCFSFSFLFFPFFLSPHIPISLSGLWWAPSALVVGKESSASRATNELNPETRGRESGARFYYKPVTLVVETPNATHTSHHHHPQPQPSSPENLTAPPPPIPFLTPVYGLRRLPA